MSDFGDWLLKEGKISQKEYDEKYFAFEQAKSKLEREYVRKAVSNPINWSLDYHTNIVTITAED